MPRITLEVPVTTAGVREAATPSGSHAKLDAPRPTPYD